MAHMSVAVVLWVEVADGDGRSREAGRAAPVAEAAAGLSPLPQGRWAPCLPPIPFHLSLASGKRELGFVDLGTLRRRALLVRCTGCSRRGDDMAKDWTDGGP